MSFLERGIENLHKDYARHLKNAERMSKETGRPLNDKYYEGKEKLERSVSHYEELKRRNNS